MKQKITFFLLLLFTIAACKKDNITTTSNSLNGKWKLVKYHNLTNGTRESEPTNISRSIILEFSDNGTQGNMQGHTVTNTVGGDYELLQGSKMRTICFGGTKVGEPKWGYKFWNAIHAASSYERQSEKLFIHFNDDNEIMEFNKE